MKRSETKSVFIQLLDVFNIEKKPLHYHVYLFSYNFNIIRQSNKWKTVLLYYMEKSRNPRVIKIIIYSK